MMPGLTHKLVSSAVSQTVWDFGNQVLYDMCRTNPEHKRDQIIIGKMWIIGRTYAAAIERRRRMEVASGDAFYETVVAPKIRKSSIDSWFETILMRRWWLRKSANPHLTAGLKQYISRPMFE
jgi:hypothetical protein